MDNDYSWTKFNPAAARKLCAYSNRREELLSWGPGICRETMKNVQNEKHTLQDVEYGEKTVKKVENDNCTLQDLEYGEQN